MAEYLAGLHLVQINGQNENAWEEFFQLAYTFKSEEVQGFIQAVQDCCQMSNGLVPEAINTEFSLWQTANTNAS